MLSDILEELKTTEPDLRELLESPDFTDTSRVHNWKNYIPWYCKRDWATLPFETKAILYAIAFDRSSSEEWD